MDTSQQSAQPSMFVHEGETYVLREDGMYERAFAPPSLPPLMIPASPVPSRLRHVAASPLASPGGHHYGLHSPARMFGSPMPQPLVVTPFAPAFAASVPVASMSASTPCVVPVAQHAPEPAAPAPAHGAGLAGIQSDGDAMTVGEVLEASCVLVGDGPSGLVTFEQRTAEPHAPVVVSVSIDGLSPGKHGFHVHAFGDLTGGCKSTGGHFNPYRKSHGAPTAEERHVGDLGNVLARDDGSVRVRFSDSQISLYGECSIVGRAIVVHAGEDDLGKGGDEGSLATGNAGARVLCGVIGHGIAAPLDIPHDHYVPSAL